jgi:GGDEF domain-containing protein
VKSQIEHGGTWLSRFEEFKYGNEGTPLIEFVWKQGLKPDGAIRRQRIPIHSLTGAFFIKEKEDRESLMAMVNALAKTATPDGPNSAYIFIDLNFLGRVNYFRRGYRDGDDYIREFGKATKQVLQSSVRVLEGSPAKSRGRKNPSVLDTIFTFGGDEFVILLQNVTPDQVRRIEERIQKTFRASELVQNIFLQQKIKVDAQIRQDVDEIKRLRTLHSAARVQDQLRQNLEPMFLRIEAEYKREVQEFDKLTPSVTFGASMIGPADNYTTVSVRAEEQYRRHKRAFNEARHLDATKYGGASGPSEVEIDLKALPKSADPEPGLDGDFETVEE